MNWMGTGSSELLFGGGIVLMATAAALTVIWGAVFRVTGKRLKKKLEQEYGKPKR